ncbi:hypothetical protein KJ925_03985 [Patescibacteria group bacterium]|nr:hypothetical protein [Patescibacteria group bacterium]
MDFRSGLVRHFSEKFETSLSFIPDPGDTSVYETIRAHLRKQVNDDGVLVLMIDGVPRELHVEDGGAEYVTVHPNRPFPAARHSGTSIKERLMDRIPYGC